MTDREIHIVTVGASIITNFLKTPAGQRRGDQLPTLRELSDFVRTDPQKASAELAAMWPYLARNQVAHAYLVQTQTPKGTACAKVLERYLKERGVTASRKSIPSFYDRSGHDGFLEGLNELLVSVSRYALRKSEQQWPIRFNATGGMKPAVAMLTYVGCSLGWPVYYRHEEMPVTVELPALPPVPRPELVRVLDSLDKCPGRRVSGRDVDLERARVTREDLDSAIKHGAVLMKEARGRSSGRSLGEVAVRGDRSVGTPRFYELSPLGRFLLAVYGRLGRYVHSGASRSPIPDLPDH